MVLAASSMPPGAVTLMGDSQTTTSQGYGGKFATMFSSVIVDNESMGGQTTAQISARYGGVGEIIGQKILVFILMRQSVRCLDT